MDSEERSTKPKPDSMMEKASLPYAGPDARDQSISSMDTLFRSSWNSCPPLSMTISAVSGVPLSSP